MREWLPLTSTIRLEFASPQYRLLWLSVQSPAELGQSLLALLQYASKIAKSILRACCTSGDPLGALRSTIGADVCSRFAFVRIDVRWLGRRSGLLSRHHLDSLRTLRLSKRSMKASISLSIGSRGCVRRRAKRWWGYLFGTSKGRSWIGSPLVWRRYLRLAPPRPCSHTFPIQRSHDRAPARRDVVLPRSAAMLPPHHRCSVWGRRSDGCERG